MTPEETASAFLVSPEFAEVWARLQVALSALQWDILSYDPVYASVRVSAGPQPAYMEGSFDLFQERLSDGEPDPGNVQRMEILRTGIIRDLLESALLGEVCHKWCHRMKLKAFQTPDPNADLFGQAVVARLGPTLRDSTNFVKGVEKLFAILRSPEIMATSKLARECQAISQFEIGIEVLRICGWRDADILAEVTASLART